MYYFKQIIFLLVLSIGMVSMAMAQQSGVKGLVLDLESLQPLAGVSLQISSTGKGTTTDANGEFFIAMPKDANRQHTVVASMLGYKSDSTSFQVTGDDAVMVSLSLLSENSLLEEVVVTRRRERASEIALLDMRRRSNLMVEMIGAQELSRKGISDAATAVSKMTGVSRQEGSNQLYVRGLGDRYNATMLNGLPIPSNDPNMKNISLNIFPTDVVDYIGVDKVTNVKVAGDFGGANVDIMSKNYTGGRMFEVNLGSNINTNVLGDFNNFQLQNGPNFFGFSNEKIPADAQGSYHFQNSWDRSKKSVVPMNFGFKIGNSYQIGSEGRLSLFAAGNFSNSFETRSGINANVNAQGAPLKSFNQVQNSYNTNTSAIFNANYQFNAANKLSYNLLFVNSGNQFADQFSGFIRDAAESGTGIVNRNTFVQTKLVINQLLGSHQLRERLSLDWGLALNNVDGDMPDRMQSMVRRLDNGEFRFIRVNAPDNHRYTYLLNEKEYAANLAFNYDLGEERGKLSVGYNGRLKNRSFDVMQLNFDLSPELREMSIDPTNLDQYLGAAGFGTLYTMSGFAGNAYQNYNGDQDIHAAFASVDYRLSDRLTGVLGLRYENIKQYVDYYSIEYRRGNNTLNKNGFLPSLNLKYTLNQKQNLRFGASKTYTLPQFKERAWFPYEDVTQTYFGNPYLYASDNYNVDLKWEWFPTQTELVSVSAFGKYIQNPINEVMVASATNDVSYVNIGDQGHVYGIEIEVKKDLLSFNGDQDKLSVGFNTAIMRTSQDIDADKVSRETDGMIAIDPNSATSRLTGASDYIVNADLTYLKRWGTTQNVSATVMYNYYSDKIFAIGTGRLGDRVDRGIGTLDLVLKSMLTNRFGLDVAARNILNPEFQRWQENVDPVKILSYKKGVFFNIGVNYRF